MKQLNTNYQNDGLHFNLTNNVSILYKATGVFIFLALYLGAVALVIHYDVIVNNNVGESSLIEYIQEALLFLTSALFFILAGTNKNARSFAVLVGAFFTCLLIRELDSFFDQIIHGFWVYPALTIASISIIYVIQRRESIEVPLINYTKHSSFGLMIAGMAILLVFSRLFGMGILWQKLMGDFYIPGVKHVAEEGIELLAYSLIFFANAWYCFDELRKK